MTTAVLATKLFVPAPRSQAIPRLRLIEQLTAGWRAGRKLTLVSAPAGFGKTTLLAEWIAQLRTQAPPVRVAWLSLDERDNDPVRFLAHLTAAFHAADPAIGPNLPDVRMSPEAVLTTLLNDMARGDITPGAQPIILFLDDLQLIEDPAVRDVLAFLLEHMPASLHVAVATRSDPLLPLARLRAGGSLTELRAADLRFARDEASAFLHRVAGVALTPEDVDVLETRTEGWIAGLQLAALSVRGSSDVSSFINDFAGSNRFVIDYLIEEVLSQVPQPTLNFLRRTAVLDRLSGPLCDAVTGRSDSTEMLEQLERSNLFLVPLDDRRHWYRYHHLFADVVRTRLSAQHGPDEVARLQRRASQWHEDNGLHEEAIEYAFGAADFSRAARVLEAIIPSVRKSRQDTTLLGWLAALPADVKNRRPVLLVFSAWASLVSGDIPAVDRQLDAAERLLAAKTEGQPEAHDSEPGEELRVLPVTIELYRAALALAMGDQDGVGRHARRALDSAVKDDHLSRGAAAGFLGLACWAGGDLIAGLDAFRDAAESLRRAGNLTDALSTTMVIADMLLPLGKLDSARELYEAALQEAVELGNGGQPTADLHAGISDILRERNDIAGARKHLAASTGLGDAASSHEHRYRWFVAMAGVYEAEGDTGQALTALDQAEQHYRRGFFPDVRPIGGLRARIQIRSGNLSEARAWVDEQSLTLADPISYLREFGHITLARLLIAEHAVNRRVELLDDALELLRRLLAAADDGGRMGSVIEIAMLQAIAHHALGETSAALAAVERALTLAEPAGYFRLFVEEGDSMLALLRLAAGAGIRPGYVRRLSQALRDDNSALIPPPLQEALTDRELHVLRLLATELSGPEIARSLFVSLNTMRTHTKSIFRKLEVGSRAAAVRRGESLGLI